MLQLCKNSTPDVVDPPKSVGYAQGRCIDAAFYSHPDDGARAWKRPGLAVFRRRQCVCKASAKRMASVWLVRNQEKTSGAQTRSSL